MIDLMEEAQTEEKMNMTPMIDVVFLLIIFFLCIEFKVLEAKLPAYLPKDKGSNTTQAEPVEQLSVKIICENWGDKRERYPNRKSTAYKLEGHRIRWEVGPTPIGTLARLKQELQKIYDNRSTWQPDKDNPGELKPMPIVIEPGEDVTYGDVAQTVDAVSAANFKEINFGGGMGGRAPGTQR